MGRRIALDEEEDWDDYDPEDELEDEEETIPCPHCRRPIHEESERCPYCENYISIEDTPVAAKPLWIVVGFLLCFFVVVLWVLRG